MQLRYVTLALLATLIAEIGAIPTGEGEVQIAEGRAEDLSHRTLRLERRKTTKNKPASGPSNPRPKQKKKTTGTSPTNAASSHAPSDAPSGTEQASAVFDCEQQPHICIANCWHAFCVEKGQALPKLDKDGSLAKINRDSSGVTGNARKKDNPCDNATLNENVADFRSLEEFPFASTAQGGADSSLRCVPQKEQSIQGSKVGKKLNAQFAKFKQSNKQFGIEFDNVAAMYAASPRLPDYCRQLVGGKSTCKNDGFMLMFKDGKYIKDTRGS